MPPLPDAVDGPPGAPDFLSEAHTYGTQVDNLSYMLDIPSGSTNRYLIVVVSIASDCQPASTSVQVTSITHDGVPLAPIKTLVGTACAAGSTRMEQWGLVAPHEVSTRSRCSSLRRRSSRCTRARWRSSA
jgi:hypothetical protein